MRRILSRVSSLFRRRKNDADMKAEILSHLELQAERNIRSGMDPLAAREGALRQFGNVTKVQETCREQRGWPVLESLAQDVRFGLRQLVRSPGFTAVAVLSLALGIGANTAIFSVVDDVLLKSLPVQNPEELVLFRWIEPAEGWTGSVIGSWEKDPVTQAVTCTSFSRDMFDGLQRDHPALAAVFAFAPLRAPTLIVEGQAEVSRGGQFVSGGYYSGLGVSPRLGRLITPDDDRPGATPTAVISDRYWQDRFGGDPAALGAVIQVNGVPVTVVGVTPRAFHGALDVGVVPDISLPLSLWSTIDPLSKIVARESGPVWWLRIMGRRNPGITAEQARANFETNFQRLARADLAATPAPEVAADTKLNAALPRLQITSGSQGLTEDRNAYARRLAILMILVGLVLLIACLNVANLLLARGAARQREIAARLALGASRARLVRQLLTESGLLTGLGAALGIAFAAAGVHWFPIVTLLGNNFSAGLHFEPALDARVLAFTVAVAGSTGLLFGLVPALCATRFDLRGGFHPAGSAGLGSRSLLARILMVTQVALSLVLLVGAGLFVRTLHALEAIDVGFKCDHVLLFRLDARPAGYDNARAIDLHERLVRQIDALPGVRATGFAALPVLSGVGWNTLIEIPGVPVDRAHPSLAMANAVSPDFFTALGLPVILGRNFTDRDRGPQTRVAVVNETLVKKYFDGENPVGRHLRRLAQSGQVEIEIVGVVRDAKYNEVKGESPATLYLPFAQGEKTGEANYIVRTSIDPATLTDSIRGLIRTVDPSLPLADARTLETQVNSLFASERLLAQVSGFFGLLALALVGVGLYGLLSYSVALRTRELGIRVALGALPGRVLRLVLGESLMLVGLGSAIGLAAALALSRLVTSQLFGVEPTDPLTLAAVVLIFSVRRSSPPGARAAARPTSIPSGPCGLNKSMKIFPHLRALLHRRKLDAEMSEEMRTHLDLQAERNIRMGLDPEEARYAAQRQFGNLPKIQELAREARGWVALEQCGRDLRHGFRTAAKNPGFSLVVIVTLALGLGINLAVVSLINATLVRPLTGVRGASELVMVGKAMRRGGSGAFSSADYQAFRAGASPVAGELATFADAEFSFATTNRSARIWGEFVSGNYFETIGVRMAAGRAFLPSEDEAPGRNPVAVISHRLWEENWQSDPTVIGRTITLNGQPFTVVGVAEPGFKALQLPTAHDIWVPLHMRAALLPASASGSAEGKPRWLRRFVARLVPGVTLAQARSHFSALARSVQPAPAPGEDYEWGCSAVSYSPFPGADLSAPRALFAILGAVALLVLGAVTVNAASLLLSRALLRQREVAVRLALGASRGRLIRQMIAEGLVLAVAAAVLGIFASGVASRWLIAQVPGEHGEPAALELVFDWRLVVASVGLTGITALSVGILPAWQGSRVDVLPALKFNAGAPSLRRSRLRSILVVAQVALSVVLLVCGGLVFRSLRVIEQIDPSRDRGGMLLARVDPRLNNYDEAHGQQFFTQLLERLAASPTVGHVALAAEAPFAEESLSFGRVYGGNLKETEAMNCNTNLIAGDYFAALGLPVVRGRTFSKQDAAGAPAVAIINRVLADQLWPAQDPIGQILHREGEEPPLLVVGVVAEDSWQRSPDQPAEELLTYYLPLAQQPLTAASLLVQGKGEQPGLLSEVRTVIREMDPHLPLFQVSTVAAARDRSHWQQRVVSCLVSFCSVAATALALLGLYAALAHDVQRRSREIGIRIAVGAAQRVVLGLIIRQGMRLTFLGLGIGMVLAAGVTQILRSILVGVSPTDALTFTVVPFALTAVAAMACWLPARRAMRVDPLLVLKTE